MKISYLLLALTLAACSLGSSSEATPTQIAATQVTVTETAQSPLLILVAPPGSDQQIMTAAAELAASFASLNSMVFEQRTSLAATEIPINLATLLVLAPDPGVAELAAAAPTVRIIAIGFTPSSAAANVQTLQAGGGDADSVAFIAGYTAELIADDWRAGMLYTPASAALVDAFVAGGEYYCGACSPVAPPYNDYPQAAQATSPQDWQAAADQLIFQSTNVVYLTPELETSGAAQYLASYGVLLIGSGSAPTDLIDHWLASVSGDALASLRQQLPQALAGEPVSETSSIALTNANSAYLSAARQSNIQAIINDLIAGYIALPSDE